MRQGFAFFACAAVLSGCMGEAAVRESTEWTHPEALLWLSATSSILVEIDYVEGYEPGNLALEAFLTAVAEHTRKPVDVLGPSAIPDLAPDPERRWSERELDKLAESASSWAMPLSTFTREGTAYVHVLYVDGDIEPPAHGVYRRGRMFVAVDALSTLGSARLPDEVNDRVERRTLVHEFGHALGLVDCGTPAVRPHGDGDCHSTNDKSVMYPTTVYNAEDALSDRLIPYEFDEDDLADLAAFRARDPALTARRS